MANIVLIGMPGSGKSTLGVLLAKAIGYSFIDTDLVLQQKSGKKLQQMITDDGLESFLWEEEETLCSVDTDNCVIATGGSAVLSEKGMTHLKMQGTVVYIKLSAAHVERRIKNIRTRGIVMAKGESIQDVYNARAPYYQKHAHITVEPGNAPIEATVGKIIKALKGAGVI